MATGVHVWSTTADSNANSDGAISWPEGMAPSAVNNSARAEMAKVAEYVKDNAGTLTTAGTDTAYTIATPNATFASLAELNGQKLKVRFNATNGAAPTLNVASLGAKAIQTASGTAVATGAILADSVHDVTYDNSIPAFLLSGAFVGVGGVFPGDVTVGGTLGVTGATSLTGDVAVNTDKLTVAAATGNTVVAGTLAVTGNSTLTGTLSVGGQAVTGKVRSRQTLTSGTGATYTTPAGARQIHIHMVGGGGGGGGSGTAGASGNGGTTSFNSITAIGGLGGSAGGNGGAGGAGGSGGSGSSSIRLGGSAGGGGWAGSTTTTDTFLTAGGAGGSGIYGAGGGAGGDSGLAGGDGVTNSGGGGGGAGGNSSAESSGASAAGGGSGERVELIINTPSATYTYTVGAAGAAGTGTRAGGSGGSGVIIVDEYY